MYNQHTREMATTRHRSLLERGGRKALIETLHTHRKKCQEKSNIHETETEEEIRAHRAYYTSTRVQSAHKRFHDKQAQEPG